MDDQLILGIKGTMSVVELKVLRMRLLAGIEEKARRGKMLRLLPPGYIKGASGKAVKDPDRRVQEALSMVFNKFNQLWSVRQTFLYFNTQQIELPVNKSIDGQIRIVWQLPTYAFIKNVLTNPFYAGAYVWGRRQTQKAIIDGKLVSKVGKIKKPQECKVFIRDHHQGYIDWQTFEENQKMITGNCLKIEKDESAAAIRSGQGFLARILRCGRCGRKLHVRYWGKSGTAARYMCKGEFDSGGQYCLAFGGATVDRRISEEILKVISPLGMRASLKTLKLLDSKNHDQCNAMRRRIEQVEYETRRAFEQYNEVDPRNRLVVAELERRWNEKLNELEQIKSTLNETQQQVEILSDQDKRRVLELGEDFQQVWESKHCTTETKKKIIRTVVEEVIVDMDDSGQMLYFTIHWKGGSHTQFEMQKPRSGAGQKTSMQDLEIIRRMGVRYGDDEIARVLNKLGRRTGKGKRWNEHRVRDMRYRYSISGQKRSKPDSEILTLRRAARYCNVSDGTIKRLVNSGLLKKRQVAPWAPWEIKRTDLESDPIRNIIKRLHKTGKLVLKGDDSEDQMPLFQ